MKAESALLEDQMKPPRRILVVDDEAAVLRLTARTLVHSGYDVDAAEDGAEAWAALQAKAYDLLITDNKMPKVSGVELIEKVRAAGMALPVIMSTGAFPEEEFMRHPQLQPAARLIKPFMLAELLTTVQEVLPATAGGRSAAKVTRAARGH
jgi:DNA-binding response OmpR family regulator